MAEKRADNRVGDDLGATQQVGDELPGSIRYGRNENDNMDDPSLAGGLDADSPSPINTAAGLSVGGTGVGIEPGIDASLGAGDSDPDEFVADVYGDEDADVDGLTDPLGMGSDAV
jgi:hypothetical protein